MLDSIFVINNTDNSLVFYGQLSDVQPEDLETILGQILMKAKGQPPGTQKLVALKQGKFLYGIYSNFVMVLALSKGTEKEAADKILQALGKQFEEKFGSELENYAGDNSPFTSFSADVQEVLSGAMTKAKVEPSEPEVPMESEAASVEEATSETPSTENADEENSLAVSKAEALNEPEETISKEETEAIFGKSEEDAEVSEEETSKTLKPAPSTELPFSQRKGMIELQKSEEVQDTFNLDKPMIPPQKRQAYPDGIPEYARDEILFNESFDVQKNFECDLVDFSVSRIKITMNISLTHIYEVEIDFTNYPERPEIIMSEGLKNELEQPIEEISYFLRNWDTRIPPHITEIVYELEKILTRFKSEGKLSPTQDMPSYVTPELEPLKGDIKYDPNYKPKSIEPPPFIPEEVKPDREIPGQLPPGAPTSPRPVAKPAPGAPMGMAPNAKPAPGVNPKDMKKKQQEDEKKRKEDAKKQQELAKQEAKKRKDFEKLKKQQAREDEAIKRRQQNFEDEDEEKKSDD